MLMTATLRASQESFFTRSPALHRFVRSSVLALALLAVTATATFAHECYVANRSSTGTQQAGTNSSTWGYLTLEDLAIEAGPIFLGYELTPAQIDVFVELAVDAGVPAEVAINQRQMLGHSSGFLQNGKGTDGQGVEHFFTKYQSALLAALDAAANAS